MPTFLQQVTLPERCFLKEALYWAAFRRLPIASFNYKGEEFRETDDIGDYDVEVGENYIANEEAERAGIPPDPRYTALLEDSTSLSSRFIARELERDDLDALQRNFLEIEKKSALAYEAALSAWWPSYHLAIEYPASTVFIALKEGRLQAKGRLLPALDKEEAWALLEERHQTAFSIPQSEIPASFWSLQGIDFEASAARNAAVHYSHVSVPTESLLALFPGDETNTLEVRQVGDYYVLDEAPKLIRAKAHRGRPAYPWERFFIEVAELVAKNQLPDKKEAAIEHFRAWFLKELNVSPSRAAVGEKLKPYYDRFKRARGQKI